MLTRYAAFVNKVPKKNDSIPGHEIKNEYILIHFPCKTYEKKNIFLRVIF